MTSPREQAIEEAAKAAFLAFADDTSTMRGLWESDASTREEFTKQTRAAIDAYESARARIDGAKMMPREATEEMKAAGIRGLELPNRLQSSRAASVYRAMHDATPKDGER